MKKIISNIAIVFLMAMALVARPKPVSTETQSDPTVKTYKVTITCNEANARVLVDGVVLGFANETYNIKEGEHTLLVGKTDFENFEHKFNLQKDMIITADIYKPGMKPVAPVAPAVKEFNLTVNASEPECKVYLNDKYLGSSNKTYKVKEGSYIVKVEKNGLEAKEGVTLDADKSIFVKLVPQRTRPNPVPVPPPAKLKEYDVIISTSEPDCQLYLNDQLLGDSNQSYKIKEGSYIIKAVKRGFKEAKEGVTVDSNKSVFIRMEREARAPQDFQKQPPVSQKPGVKMRNLTVLCSEADATVYIDGVEMGKPNQTFRVEDGNRKVLVVKPGYDAFEMLVACDTDNRTVEAKIRPRKR